MTFQPPPPGDNPPPPPPPPPGQWGPPPGGPGKPAFDPKTVNSLDWTIIGAGVLAFIFSFVSYYTYSAKGFGGFADENAWHGFFGWFAMLLALAGSAAVALEYFMPQVKMPWPNRVVGLAAYALAAIFVILAGLIDARSIPSGFGISSGRGAGYWLSLIVILGGVVLSFMRAQQTGTALPGPLNNLPRIGPKNS